VLRVVLVSKLVMDVAELRDAERRGFELRSPAFLRKWPN
jgi:hypothetical protein